MLDFRFYIALALRRLPFILIITAAGMAVGVGLAMTLPPEYRASARLVVESEQIPGDLAESTVRTAATEQLQIIEQRIKARDTLLTMAERLNVYPDGFKPGEGPLRPDEIVRDLRERISIRVTGAGRSARRNSGNALLVDVSFVDSSPTLAAEVTNDVVTLMQEENRAMRTGVSGETLEFFEQEVERLNEELSRRGEEIIRFQEANRDALPESLEFRRNQLIRAQEELLSITRSELELSDQRDSAMALFEQTGGLDLSAAQVDTLSPEERQLRQLRERYTTSAAVLSPDNPRMQVIQAQINALEQLVAAQAGATTGLSDNAAANSTRTSLFNLEIAELESQLDFLKSRREQLETEMAALQASIEATPANTIALDTLQRDYAATRRQFDQAVASRARAKTGDIIEALSKGERITLLDAAVAPNEPFSPNRPRLAVMGTAGGMALAIGIVVLLELLNTSIRRSRDISRQLEITPFATLPYIRTRGERIRRRIVILAALILVVAGIMGGLWAIDQYFRPLDQLLGLVLDRLRGFGLPI